MVFHVALTMSQLGRSNTCCSLPSFFAHCFFFSLSFSQSSVYCICPLSHPYSHLKKIDKILKTKQFLSFIFPIIFKNVHKKSNSTSYINIFFTGHKLFTTQWQDSKYGIFSSISALNCCFKNVQYWRVIKSLMCFKTGKSRARTLWRGYFT